MEGQSSTEHKKTAHLKDTELQKHAVNNAAHVAGENHSRLQQMMYVQKKYTLWGHIWYHTNITWNKLDHRPQSSKVPRTKWTKSYHVRFGVEWRRLQQLSGTVPFEMQTKRT